MEHRWGERIRLDIPVQLRGPAGCVAAGCISNASLSGAFIQTPLQQGALSRLDVIVNGHELSAYVVRVTAEGLGIEWCELSAEIVAQLLLAQGASATAVARALDDPELAATPAHPRRTGLR